MNNKEKLPSDFATKVTAGVNKALLKMAAAAAANNEDLIVGNKDGSFKSVSAKEVLNILSK